MKGILQLINSAVTDEPDLVIANSVFIKYSEILLVNLNNSNSKFKFLYVSLSFSNCDSMHCWNIFILMFSFLHWSNTFGKSSPNDFAAWLPPNTKMFNTSGINWFFFFKI